VFVIACSSCARRQLIFPSQVVRVDGSDVVYRCWCGAEQVWTPGTGTAHAA
jgi:hypothetical protein